MQLKSKFVPIPNEVNPRVLVVAPPTNTSPKAMCDTLCLVVSVSPEIQCWAIITVRCARFAGVLNWQPHTKSINWPILHKSINWGTSLQNLIQMV